MCLMLKNIAQLCEKYLQYILYMYCIRCTVFSMKNWHLSFQKYLHPMKNPANSFAIEPNLVDKIFFQVS
jgi:hypothetical protein